MCGDQRKIGLFLVFCYTGLLEDRTQRSLVDL
jgi:hypothetical protein